MKKMGIALPEYFLPRQTKVINRGGQANRLGLKVTVNHGLNQGG
jgi:hypothetical protein